MSDPGQLNCNAGQIGASGWEAQTTWNSWKPPWFLRHLLLLLLHGFGPAFTQYCQYVHSKIVVIKAHTNQVTALDQAHRSPPVASHHPFSRQLKGVIVRFEVFNLSCGTSRLCRIWTPLLG